MPSLLTLETNLVPLERSNGLAEKLFCVDIAGLYSRYVDLLPFNGNVVGLEDLTDRLGDFGTDTVTWGLVNGLYDGF